MGLFKRLFGFIKVQQNTQQKSPIYAQDRPKNVNVIRILECEKYINDLLTSDRYIPRSEYVQMIAGYSSDIEFFSVLKKSGMFEEFCLYIIKS